MIFSPKTREKKSPEQIDLARERQRLARRAKRAAKARCRGEDSTGIEDDAIFNHSGESTPDGKGNEGYEYPEPCFGLKEDYEVSNHSGESTPDGKGNEGHGSPDPFSGLEEADVRRMISLEMSTLQGSYEQGLPRVNPLHEKEVDKALATVVWFLRASEDPHFQDRWILRAVRPLFHSTSWPVAVVAMRNIVYGNPKKVSNQSWFSCKSQSLELWATFLSTSIAY